MNRTLNGRPISGVVSGFDFSTENSGTELMKATNRIITPSDLLNELKIIRESIQKTDTIRLYKELLAHVNDTNNPHKTDLHHFLSQVVDVLYAEYQRCGGNGTFAFYSDALFRTLRIATVEEMENCTDPNLLISVLNAKKCVMNHESDPDAHHMLFTSLLPGEPILENPTIAVNAAIGISPFVMEEYDAPKKDSEVYSNYTYIGEDGRIHYSDSGEFNITYVNGDAVFPCFSARKNYINESNNFLLSKLNNVSTISDAEVCPDGEINATAISTYADSSSVRHSVAIRDVELFMGEVRTFSVFAKRESCRYFALVYKDMSASPIEVKAVFDLDSGSCYMLNHMNRYKQECHKLNDGWYRCSISMYHKIGQSSDLEMVFFKESADETLTFQGINEICGYLWGMQLEDGLNMSPFIPTTGSPAVRKPIGISIPLDSFQWTPDEMTLHMAYRNPGTHWDTLDEFLVRPIFSITDGNEIAVDANYHSTGDVDVTRYARVTSGDISLSVAVYQDIFNSIPDSWCHLTHGIDSDTIFSSLNTTHSIRTTVPREWLKGDTLHIGHNGKSVFVEGYVRSFSIYPICVTDEQINFLNGEQYRD